MIPLLERSSIGLLPPAPVEPNCEAGTYYMYILCVQVRKNPPDEDPYWKDLACKNRTAGAHYEHRNRRVEADCKNGTHKYRGWAWLLVRRNFQFVFRDHHTVAVFRSC